MFPQLLLAVVAFNDNRVVDIVTYSVTPLTYMLLTKVPSKEEETKAQGNLVISP